MAAQAGGDRVDGPPARGERDQPAGARRIHRPRGSRRVGRRAAVLALAPVAGERMARRPRRDGRGVHRRRARRAGGDRRRGAPLPRPPPRLRHAGQLRLRPLRLPRGHPAGRVGRARGPGLGRRAGGDPGPDLGAQLPAHRRPRDVVLRRRRRSRLPDPPLDRPRRTICESATRHGGPRCSSRS